MPRGDSVAPYCTDCHGDHDILAVDDPGSPVFARNIPDLCGDCHRSDQTEARLYTDEEQRSVAQYAMSIHGKGILDSGLLVTATCKDCHSAHLELPSTDTLSGVHPANIAGTCATCHLGVYEEFSSSIHSASVNDTDAKTAGLQ